MPDTPELFVSEETTASRRWASVERALYATKISPLEAWKEQYRLWKELYEMFRRAEQQGFYAADETGKKPVTPTAEDLRAHRQCIAQLLQLGQLCCETLLRVQLEGVEAEQRHDWHIRIETLLAALRESLEIWHPANQNHLDEMRHIFSRQAV